MNASDIQNKLPQPLRNRFRQGLYWASAGGHAIVPNAGGSYYVLGHPKSGTNWLCSILSDYFGYPVFESWKRLTPAASPQIFHMHRFIPTKQARRRTFYIYRDGRDIVVSRFFEMARTPWAAEAKNAFCRYAGEPMDEKRIQEQLPVFISWLFETNKSSSLTWPEHVRQGLKKIRLRLSFEGMKRDGFRHLKRAITEMTGRPVDRERLMTALERNEFHRKKTVSGNGYFMRSGSAGDWVRYFTPEAAETFADHAQGALERLGYERSTSWVERCDEGGVE